MHRVFIVSRDSSEYVDLDSLQTWGEICPLFESNKQVPSIFQLQEAVGKFRLKLHNKGFDPEHDYVVLVGKQMHIAILCLSITKDYIGETVNFLIWDSPNERYIKKGLIL